MEYDANAQPANKAELSEVPIKQFDGKHFMGDAKEALYFLQHRAAEIIGSLGFCSYSSNMKNTRSAKNFWDAIKVDVTRLVTAPAFWALLVLASMNAAASVATILWVFCAPLLLHNSDFFTWALRENRAKYTGKVVWVTGGSTGIGLAICKHLSVRGVKGLIITGRYLSRLETAREQILSYARSQGATMEQEDILLLPLDLTKGLRPEKGGEEASAAEMWEETVQQAIHWRGGVDILFNNAGRLAVGCLPPTETFAEVMDANFLSVIKLTNLLLPHMRARDQGHIVFTNSSSAHFNFGGFNAYATSKVALLSFSNLLRQDLRGCGSKGVLVTSVHPGYIETNIHQNLSDPLVDDSCNREVKVKWNQKGLDLDFATSLILRAVSRDLEEAWLAVPVGLLPMYVGYYFPHLVQFARRFTAKKECAITSEYREAIVSQLTGCNGNRK